jgi:uncharacterized protein YndB with AHSA1/START domain
MPDPLYSVEREYPVPMERMWGAWTDAAALEAWYHPTDLHCVPGSVISDAMVGGGWAVSVDVPQHGLVAYFYGVYTRVEVGRVLEHSMHYTQSAEEFTAKDLSVPAHRVVVDFEPRAGGTWVRFAQFGELPEGEAPRAKSGMESYFDSLGAYLATNRP